jgi:serine/threonine protein kinase
LTAPDDPTQAVPAAAVLGGRYRLDELVGRGGTAEVWKATDTSLDRVVAVKLVTAAHDESSARAADEARTLAKLSHPALVQVYDAGTDGSGRPWVVMEFVDGETLADAIRRGPLPVRRITEIGLDVADALEHVHAQGLVHRDVKPANVLLSRGGGSKLTDFGIARLVDSAKVTSTGLMVGTASYLAPEQVAGEPVGPPVDVYALGLLLLETLTGKREYEGPAVEAAMARLHRLPAIPVTLPPGWGELLGAMTARHAADRPTAGDVATVLHGLLSGDTSATTVLPALAAPLPQTQVTRAAPSAVVVPQKQSRATTWVAALLAVVAVGIGVGFVASQQDGDTPRTIPTVDSDVPAPLQNELKSFVDKVLNP